MSAGAGGEAADIAAARVTIPGTRSLAVVMALAALSGVAAVLAQVFIVPLYPLPVGLSDRSMGQHLVETVVDPVTIAAPPAVGTVIVVCAVLLCLRVQVRVRAIGGFVIVVVVLGALASLLPSVLTPGPIAGDAAAIARINAIRRADLVRELVQNLLVLAMALGMAIRAPGGGRAAPEPRTLGIVLLVAAALAVVARAIALFSEPVLDRFGAGHTTAEPVETVTNQLGLGMGIAAAVVVVACGLLLLRVGDRRPKVVGTVVLGTVTLGTLALLVLGEHRAFPPDLWSQGEMELARYVTWTSVILRVLRVIVQNAVIGVCGVLVMRDDDRAPGSGRRAKAM